MMLAKKQYSEGKNICIELNTTLNIKSADQNYARNISKICEKRGTVIP